MTSAFSGADVSGIESQIEGLIPTFQQYASDAANIGPVLAGNAATEFGQSVNTIYPTAADQFVEGAAGQVTPAQQAAIDQTKKQMDLQTTGTYGNLGLGNSTMESQDLGANAQKSLAQETGFSALDEQLGLSGLGTALGYENASTTANTGAVNAYGTAGNILGQAASALSGVGGLAAGQEALQAQLFGSIGSALGGKL
jgi:hypothetical protein